MQMCAWAQRGGAQALWRQCLAVAVRYLAALRVLLLASSGAPEEVQQQQQQQQQQMETGTVGSGVSEQDLDLQAQVYAYAHAVRGKWDRMGLQATQTVTTIWNWGKEEGGDGTGVRLGPLARKLLTALESVLEQVVARCLALVEQPRVGHDTEDAEATGEGTAVFNAVRVGVSPLGALLDDYGALIVLALIALVVVIVLIYGGDSPIAGMNVRIWQYDDAGMPVKVHAMVGKPLQQSSLSVFSSSTERGRAAGHLTEPTPIAAGLAAQQHHGKATALSAAWGLGSGLSGGGGEFGVGGGEREQALQQLQHAPSSRGDGSSRSAFGLGHGPNDARFTSLSPTDQAAGLGPGLSSTMSSASTASLSTVDSSTTSAERRNGRSPLRDRGRGGRDDIPHRGYSGRGGPSFSSSSGGGEDGGSRGGDNFVASAMRIRSYAHQQAAKLRSRIGSEPSSPSDMTSNRNGDSSGPSNNNNNNGFSTASASATMGSGAHKRNQPRGTAESIWAGFRNGTNAEEKRQQYLQQTTRRSPPTSNGHQSADSSGSAQDMLRNAHLSSARDGDEGSWNGGDGPSTPPRTPPVSNSNHLDRGGVAMPGSGGSADTRATGNSPAISVSVASSGYESDRDLSHFDHPPMSSAATDVLQTSVRNPSALIGWKINVSGLGVGVVVSTSKTAMRKTQYRVQFTDGSERVLRLKRSERKGQVPFVPLERMSTGISPRQPMAPVEEEPGALRDMSYNSSPARGAGVGTAMGVAGGDRSPRGVDDQLYDPYAGHHAPPYRGT